MTQNNHDFCQRCDLQFASLNPGYLAKVAVYLGWTLEDLQQEFRLLSWEIESGIDGFDSSKGDLLGYFIGRLQNKLHKSIFLNFAYSTDCDDGDEMARHSHAGELTSGLSVLDHMVDREDRLETQRLADQVEQEAENITRLKTCLSEQTQKHHRRGWIQRLWNQGLSQTQIASVGGVSQSLVSRHLNGRQSTAKAAYGRSDHASVTDLRQGVLF